MAAATSASAIRGSVPDFVIVGLHPVISEWSGLPGSARPARACLVRIGLASRAVRDTDRIAPDLDVPHRIGMLPPLRSRCAMSSALAGDGSRARLAVGVAAIGRVGRPGARRRPEPAAVARVPSALDDIDVGILPWTDLALTGARSAIAGPATSCYRSRYR